eukprot:PITA_02802
MVISGKIEIEKFNGQSFELWKLKMEDLLVDNDQWIVVDPGTKPTGVFDEGCKKLDWKAKNTIRLCISNSVLLNVSGEATMKALWDKLGILYQFKSLVNKLFLQKKLYNLRMKDGDSVTEHLNTFNTMFDEIVSSLLKKEMRRKNMESHNGDALSVHGQSQNRKKNKSSSGRKARIIGCGKVKMKLKGGRVRTLSSVLHIPTLARNLIYVSKLDDAGVKTVFEENTCKMVRGALVLMRGVQTGTMYKLQGITVIDGCNSSVVPENRA